MNRELKTDRLLFGGDYNPEQWLDSPEVLAEDLRLMRLSHVNAVSIGIFSWAALEPEEGVFQFDWLDERIEALSRNGQKVILATPSGAKPNWMAWKYEEIRRVTPQGIREPQSGRHNHCPTSPVYRERVRSINTLLAQRYGDHSALVLWHLSNEFGGYCYCDLCLEAFRGWLRRRYKTLDALNAAWWSHFWSHSFRSWEEIRFVDRTITGTALDWRRFMTHQVCSFIDNEAEPIRALTPDLPVTTNFMTFFRDYDYWELARHLDVISWDAYPRWHSTPDDVSIALEQAFIHDQFHAMKKGKPHLLMECTPSNTNWQPISRPKRPGVHLLSSLQAVAHGSDSVLHFQFRKSRGSCEQHHGAFVDHVGHENTRIFREVTETGRTLEALSELVGCSKSAQAAVIFDWENWWAIEISDGPRNEDKDYEATCIEWYRPLWERGVTTHVVDQTADLSEYRLVVAPMSYLIRPGFADRVEAFVRKGGCFIGTYLSGWVNETALAHLGGFPGPLRRLLGIWVEEMDVLDAHTPQSAVSELDNEYGLSGAYDCRHFAEVVHLEGAESIARFSDDYYAGSPAVTVNAVGEGIALYVGGRCDGRLTDDLLSHLVESLELRSMVATPSPGISIQERGEFLFVMNFTATPKRVEASEFSSSLGIAPSLNLSPYGLAILRKEEGRLTVVKDGCSETANQSIVMDAMKQGTR
jgi:beta-galactosidase